VLIAVRDGFELIMPGLKNQGDISEKSLTSLGIHSLICMPAKLGDYTYGCLYLDSSLREKPFLENQLPYVRLLCSQIAVGLSNIKIYEQMKELKDRFEEEAIFYKHEMGIAAPTKTIIGKSESMKHVIEQVRQVAPTDSSVLVVGETGVGKELIAKAIHNLSKRKDGPFIPVNLAALPQDLVASELFGHERGAFTGAHEKHKGRFELAHGGTIFLDEIGDLPLNVQVKLLRVLQEGSFERLGSTKEIRSDFRVIAATNKDLHGEVEKGAFRQDLYYRLNVFPVYVSPLRERKEDIPSLAHHFIDTFGKKMGKQFGKTTNEALKMLMKYTWPGNVRELEHFIERAVILSDGGKIHFPGLDEALSPCITDESLPVTPLADMERVYIEKILNATRWRVSGPNGAAAILGLKPTTLISRMKKLGIKKPVAPEFLGQQ
jgi:transcriptional regulator with GAF, ATPase, and Fis domain